MLTIRSQDVWNYMNKTYKGVWEFIIILLF